MKNSKYRFDCTKYTLLVIILIHATFATAFNTENAMNYNFSHKIATQPSPKKTFKINKISQKTYRASSKLNSPPIPNIPKSKTSGILKCPLVLKEAKKKTPPVKVVPQFGTVAAGQVVNSDYLYNGISHSNISFDYNSTDVTINQNSINFTYPLDKRHK